MAACRQTAQETPMDMKTSPLALLDDPSLLQDRRA